MGYIYKTHSPYIRINMILARTEAAAHKSKKKNMMPYYLLKGLKKDHTNRHRYIIVGVLV